jgi:hypothetical protein
MNRTLSMLILVLFATLCQPATAEAMWWAWLEKWSGPGPFRADVFRTYLFTVCVQDSPQTPIDEAKDLAAILETDKKLSLKPSPIAMNDTFHRTRTAIANASGTVDRDFLKKLLASPQLTESLRYEHLRPAILPPRGASEKPQVQTGTQPPTSEQIAATRPLFNVQSVRTLYDQPGTEVGPGHDHKSFVCGYFDIGSFKADADQDPARGFPALTAQLYDFGPSARIHDGIDIGGGFGFVTFRGEGLDNVTRATFTPLRVILRPILIAVPDHWRSEWMGVFSFYWKETYVWGRLSGEDFGVNNGWTEDGELVRSFGATLDLTALLPAFKRWFDR